MIPETYLTVRLNQRQLFLDDQGIASRDNLTKTMHQPEKKGAVIRTVDQFRTSAGPVVWDRDKKVWKCWTAATEDMPSVVGYWESDDGLHWRDPVVGQVEYRGSKNNNFVSIDLGKDTGRFAPGNVIYDTNDPDPDRRFKCALPPHGFGVSPDGINWTPVHGYVKNEDSYAFSFDEQENLFILSMREGKLTDRRVTLSTSTDFENWTEPQLIFRADERDQEIGRETIERHNSDPTLQTPEFDVPETYNAQVYTMPIFRYESVYIGLPMMFFRSAQLPPDWEGFDSMNLTPYMKKRVSRNGFWTGVHVVQVTCSRDLKNWERVGDRKPFLSPSRLGSGAYDTQCVASSSQPVVRGNELWFYYMGMKCYAIVSEGRYGHRSGKDIGAGCLAVLRRDGFVSLDSLVGPGNVTTMPFYAPAKASHLCVNANAPHGTLDIEILDGEGNIVARSETISGNQPDKAVRWDDGNISDWVGREISLRFNLNKGSLYSYWLQ